jgi:YidC/Oxa1 family membrane protein insertase
MISQLMGWIYTAISWILLRWHDLWDVALGGVTFLGTNWDWILSIVFLVITIRVILFPIFVKQIRSQRAMQALQPKVKELQEKYKGDKETLRQEMMKLYQTEKVNPLMGCLPMFLQIPVFLGLFHVLKHLNPFGPNGAPMDAEGKQLYGWSISQFDSAAKARLFDAPIPAHFSSSFSDLVALQGNGVTVKVVSAVLVLIMMATTFLTSRQMILKTGWSQDPQQRMIQKLMLYGIPFSLLVSGWYFPIGVIIYWVTQNLFSLGQQYWVLHKYPPPVTADNIPMRTAKKAAPTAQRGFLARLVAPKDGDISPTANVASRFVKAAQQPKSGMFRRRPQPPAIEPATPESRSLAPKPGAKPVHPKQAAADPKAATKRAAAAPADPPPAGPVSASPASANGGAQSGTGQSGTGQSGTGQSGATAGAAKPGAARSGGGSGGGPKSAAAKKSSAIPRKGPANKKGGPRR